MSMKTKNNTFNKILVIFFLFAAAYLIIGSIPPAVSSSLYPLLWKNHLLGVEILIGFLTRYAAQYEGGTIIFGLIGTGLFIYTAICLLQKKAFNKWLRILTYIYIGIFMFASILGGHRIARIFTFWLSTHTIFSVLLYIAYTLAVKESSKVDLTVNKKNPIKPSSLKKRQQLLYAQQLKDGVLTQEEYDRITAQLQ